MELIDLFTGFIVYYVVGLLILQYFFNTENDDRFIADNKIVYYGMLVIFWPLVLVLYCLLKKTLK